MKIQWEDEFPHTEECHQRDERTSCVPRAPSLKLRDSGRWGLCRCTGVCCWQRKSKAAHLLQSLLDGHTESSCDALIFIIVRLKWLQQFYMYSSECLHHCAAVKTRCQNENDALKREIQELGGKRSQAVSICLIAGSSGERMKKFSSDGVNERDTKKHDISSFSPCARAPAVKPFCCTLWWIIKASKMLIVDECLGSCPHFMELNLSLRFEEPLCLSV